MKKKNSTRIIAIVLVLLMALALIPIAASAAAPESGECTIIFDGNGGTTGGESPQPSTTQEYTMGETPDLDANPFSREGYSFDGWNTQDDGLGDPVSADDTVEALNSLAAWHGSTITLYAQWTPILTIVYATTVSGQDPVTRTYDAQCAALPTAGDLGFTNENHEFVKWHVEENSQEPEAGDLYPASPVTEPTTYNLTTIWAHLYTVTFNVNGGSGSPAPSTQRDGYNVAFPADGTVTRTGYILKGWSEDQAADPDDASALVDPGTYSKTADVTLYAIWKQDRVPVTFANGSGGTKAGPTLLRGQSYEIPDSQFPDPEAKTFSHWKDEANNKTYQVGDFLDWTSVGDAASVTLTAQWVDIQTVDFKPGTGATVKPASAASVGIPEGKKLGDKLSALPTAEMTDGSKVFEGWYTETNGAGTKITLDYVPTQLYTQVYANWVSAKVSFTYDPNGGTPTSKDPTKVTRGESYTFLPADTFTAPEGKTFSHWSIEGSTEPKDPGDTYPTDNETPETLTVTANWVNEYTVTFNANGGTPATTPVKVVDGGKVPESSFPTVTREGYTFLDWYVGDTTTKFDKDSVVTGNTTVKAKWLNNTVVVTFNANGGTGSKTQNMSRVEAGSLTAFSETGIGKPDGMIFKGWSLTADGAKQFDDKESVTWNGSSGDKNYAAPAADPANPGAVTLFAVWEAKLSGTVTIKKDGTALNDETNPALVNDELTAVLDPTASGLLYQWMRDGKDISGATGETYTVTPDDNGKKISVKVTNDPNFSYSIKSGEFTVKPDPTQVCAVTVKFAGETPTAFTVKVNGTAVSNNDTVENIPWGSSLNVTLEAGSGTTVYVSKLQLGETVIEGGNVAAVNLIKVPDEETCDLTVTFAKKGGKNKTATIDPNADTSATKAAIVAKAKDALPDGQKDRYWANAFDVVPCWDNQVTNTLKIPDEIPAGGLSFTLPYPAGSDFNATVAANMPAYYDITVYHRDGSTVKAITNVTANKAFAAGVTVTGQKDFSDFGVSVTPKALKGTVTLDPDTAHVGTPITAAYKPADPATPAQGTLKYQWQRSTAETGPWTDLATGQSYTPKKDDIGKYLRCIVTTTNFETKFAESKAIKVAAVPNPMQQQYVINNGNSKYPYALPGLIGNLTSDMEYYPFPQSSKPSASSSAWTKVASGKTVSGNLYEGGTYWVRFYDDQDNSNWRSVTIDAYYTVTADPDSVSVNRLYFTASGSYYELIEGRVWLVPSGKSINVSANSANTNYYKITRISYENLETGKVYSKTVNKLNTGSTGSITVNAPYYVWASAGVYGSKTGDSSHLELWVELAALSAMGLGAALVIGRKKLKEQK